MFKLTSLASSSRGNCHILSDGKTSIMLDAGLSLSKIRCKLYEQGITLDEIKGCFITHEHLDHSKAAKELSQYIEVYMSSGTTRKIKELQNINLIKHNQEVEIGTLKIIPFDVRHNAYEPLGFVVINSLGESFIYITDTGNIEINIDLSPSLLLVECNYDELLLEQLVKKGLVPEFLLERMNSNEGHLSIQKLVKLLKKLNLGLCQQIVLCHVSENNGMDDFALIIEKETNIKTKQLLANQTEITYINKIDYPF